MTDISKCEGKGCEIKHTCWRYKAPADIYQSYIIPENPGKDCEHYWKD